MDIVRIYGHFKILKNMFFENFSKIRNDSETKLHFHHHSYLNNHFGKNNFLINNK